MKILIIYQPTLRKISLIYYKDQIPVNYMNGLTSSKTETYFCTLCTWEVRAKDQKLKVSLKLRKPEPIIWEANKWINKLGHYKTLWDTVNEDKIQ